MRVKVPVVIVTIIFFAQTILGGIVVEEDFEEGLFKWNQMGPGVKIELTSNAYEGQKALKISNPKGVGLAYMDVLIHDGNRYGLSAWCNNNDAVGSAWLRIRLFDYNYMQLGEAQSEPVVNNQYQQISVGTVIASSGASIARIELVSTWGSACFDNVRLTDLGPQTMVTGLFAVYVSANTIKSNAENDQKLLHSCGYGPVHIDHVGEFYKVRVGGSYERSEAHKLVRDLKEEKNNGLLLFPDTYVLKASLPPDGTNFYSLKVADSLTFDEAKKLHAKLLLQFNVPIYITMNNDSFSVLLGDFALPIRAAGFNEKISGKSGGLELVEVEVKRSYKVIIPGLESLAETQEKKAEYETLLNCSIEISYNHPFFRLCFGSYKSEVDAFKKGEELKNNNITKSMVVQGTSYSYSPVK